MAKSVTGTLSAVGNATEPLKVPSNVNLQNFGKVVVLISGTWEGTISLRRSTDGGDSYQTVDTYTENTVKRVEYPVVEADLILEIESGNWTSGSASVVIEK